MTNQRVRANTPALLQNKLHDMIDKMDREQTFCTILMAQAILDGRDNLAAALSTYYHKIGKVVGAELPDPDWSLLSSLKMCVPNDDERKAWSALFIFPTLRGDAECLAAAEAAVRIRLAH